MRQGLAKLVLTGLFLMVAAGSGGGKELSASPVQENVALANLPEQGRDTYRRIHQGGPFRFEKDGAVFGNRERLLPGEKRGYYREYTVETAGSKNRGVRRIVCGGAATMPDACYYTADHYASFRRIVP